MICDSGFAGPGATGDSDQQLWPGHGAGGLSGEDWCGLTVFCVEAMAVVFRCYTVGLTGLNSDY